VLYELTCLSLRDPALAGMGKCDGSAGQLAAFAEPAPAGAPAALPG
jgi:hypothetical protein